MNAITRHATKTERIIAATFLPLVALEYFFAKLFNDKSMVKKLGEVWQTAYKGVVTIELAY